MENTNQQRLHFEKGQAYLGTDNSTPVDLSKAEFSGLKEVVSQRSITSGDYIWDVRARELSPASSSGAR